MHTGIKYRVPPAVLAAVPLPLVHDTVPVLPAGVGQLLPHCPLEEPLRKVLFQRERPGIDVEKSCVQANFFTEPLKNLYGCKIFCSIFNYLELMSCMKYILQLYYKTV